MKTGRPSKYTAELAQSVLDAISDGASVVQACRGIGIARSTFNGWVLDDVDGLSARYARAQRLQIMAWEDDTIDIADNNVNDWAENNLGLEVFNADHVKRVDVRIKQRNYLCERIGGRLAAKAGGIQFVPVEAVMVLIDGLMTKKAEIPGGA